jgi:hypothetical protein
LPHPGCSEAFFRTAGQAMSGTDGMDSSRSLSGIIVPGRGRGLFRLSTSKEESEMNLTTIAVDLAKDVFQVGVADRQFSMRLPM